MAATSDHDDQQMIAAADQRKVVNVTAVEEHLVSLQYPLQQTWDGEKENFPFPY